MPFYAWRGVDLAASFRRGVSFARSKVELDTLLFEQDVALVSARQTWFFPIKAKISTAQKIAFFKQASVLLSSGLQIPNMLSTVIAQCSRSSFKEILVAIHAYVQEGEQLSNALSHYPEYFSAVMVRMVEVGENSGTLAPAMQALADYLESMESFRKKIRAAMMLPLLTLSFFAMMVIVMLLIVVPQFHDIFRTLGGTMPWSTACMMQLSDCLRSWWPLFLCIVSAIVFLVFMHRKFILSENFFQNYVLKIPIARIIQADMTIVYIMHACSMLIAGGVHMTSALNITQFVIASSVLREQFAEIIQKVNTGFSLSKAVQESGKPFACEEIIALLAVGQESGSVAPMMARIATLYQDKVERMLNKIMLLAQPVLMLFLGVLIMTMIISIYAPLFNMAHMI